MPTTSVITKAQWHSAKEEIRAILIERAKTRGKIPYSELVAKLRSVSLSPDDPPLADLLAEVSTEESAAGRGMLTAIVVHKHGDMQPGPGFFTLAKRLGRNTSNRDKCWIDEFNRVYASAAKPR